MKKKELRKIYSQKRNEISKEEWKKKSHLIFERLISLKEFEKCDNIFCFISTKSEIDTKEIIEFCFGKNISVAAPRVNSNKEMDFYIIESLEDLEVGSYGILEPKTDLKMVHPNDNSIILMPGLVFDKIGGRIGYGGGFYDKYLSKYPAANKVAIAFELQLLENEILPVEECDIKYDILITEYKIYRNLV